MLFNSVEFIIFFIIVLLIYWLILKDQRQRILFLTAASFIFYAYHRIPYLLLLIYSILLNYFCAIKIFNSRKLAVRKRFLIIGIAGNLSVLCFFKYTNLLIDVILNLFPFLRGYLPQITVRLPLPLGISFFTFQGMAYMLDVYRRDINPEGNIINFAFFKSFFSQLIAGPILRAKDFLPQLALKKKISIKNFELGVYLILWGLVKKVVIADNLSPIVSKYFTHPQDNFFAAWVAIYAFAYQIYCDFSGYCDIAIGCAGMLGYQIPVNFRQPYLSESITSFWRRWHITLSNWFRDYLFIQLGGSKAGEWRYYRNLLFVMAIAGLWHGAKYTFIFWGIYHGILLIVDKVYMKYVKIQIPRVLGILITFHLVCIGWIFFRASDVESAKNILLIALNIKAISRAHVSGNINPLFFAFALLILQILERRFNLKQNFIYFPAVVRSVFVIVASVSVVIYSMNSNQFIYFAF